MGTIIHDLDILRPEPKSEVVILGKREIDISFVPSGIALKIINLKEKLEKVVGSKEKIKNLQKDEKAAIFTFDLMAELCSEFTRYQYEDMNKEWLLKNTDIFQLKSLIDLITTSVYKSLEGLKLEPEEEEELKNSQEATKTEK